MKKQKLHLWLFFVLNLILSTWYLDSWENSNPVSRSLPVISYFESGSFKIDKYHEITVDKAYVNGHYYTDKAPLPTYLILPFYGILKATGLVQPDANGNLYGKEIYLLGGFLTASLPFAFILLSLFKKIKQENKSIVPAALLSTLPFYGSFIFIYAGTFFAHILAGAFLLYSYLQLKKGHYFVAGIFSGLSFLSEYNLAVIIFLWGIILWARERKFKPFMTFSLGILPSLVFILIYNAFFSTSPFTFLYKYHNFNELSSNYGFMWPTFEAFWGLTFSPYRGIFFYTPVLLFALILWMRKFNFKTQGKLFGNYLFIPFVAYFIFIASYFAWWGGWTYGPRLLFAMVLILLFEAVVWLSKQDFKPWLFYLFAFAGLLVILPGKATIVYSAQTGILNPFIELVMRDTMRGTFNPNNLTTYLFDLPPIGSFIAFLLIFFSSLLLLSYNKLWQKK